MRLQLKLKTNKNSFLSPNYHYNLSAAIYKLLHFSSPEFSAFLHDIGYKHLSHTYKLFTFALRLGKIEIVGGKIKILTPEAYLYISSPIIEQFIKNFIIGTFEKQDIIISNKDGDLVFTIEQMELVPEPHFTEEMRFILLSPLVLSTRKLYNGKVQQYFLRPDENRSINRILTLNLSNKYSALYNREIDDSELILNWDKEYLHKHKRVTKKITINENGRFPIDVIGMQAPFTIRGNPELIKVGYQCGFGEKNSMGFGMAEVIQKQIRDRKANEIN